MDTPRGVVAEIIMRLVSPNTTDGDGVGGSGSDEGSSGEDRGAVQARQSAPSSGGGGDRGSSEQVGLPADHGPPLAAAEMMGGVEARGLRRLGERLVVGGLSIKRFCGRCLLAAWLVALHAARSLFAFYHGATTL